MGAYIKNNLLNESILVMSLINVKVVTISKEEISKAISVYINIQQQNRVKNFFCNKTYQVEIQSMRRKGNPAKRANQNQRIWGFEVFIGVKLIKKTYVVESNIISHVSSSLVVNYYYLSPALTNHL